MSNNRFQHANWKRDGHEAATSYHWYGDQLLTYCQDAGFYGAVRAAYYLRAYIRNMIGIQGTPETPSKWPDPPKRQTGLLKDSIKVLTDSRQSEAVVYSDVEYWFYLEYGTKRMPGGRPFWRRAIAETELTIQAVTRSAMLEYMASKLVRRTFDPNDVQFGESGE